MGETAGHARDVESGRFARVHRHENIRDRFREKSRHIHAFRYHEREVLERHRAVGLECILENLRTARCDDHCRDGKGAQQRRYRYEKYEIGCTHYKKYILAKDEHFKSVFEFDTASAGSVRKLGELFE